MNTFKIQVNGKNRSSVNIPAGTDAITARNIAASVPEISKIVGGQAVKRVIFSGYIINFVVV